MNERCNLGLAAVLSWIMISALQFGFHTSGLNSLQGTLICTPSSPSTAGLFSFPTCADITQNQFGVVTSAFVLGGLISSFQGGRLADGIGRKGTAVVAAGFVIAGGVSLSVAENLWGLVLGRLILGLACGISTVLTPLFLSEVAPANIKGSLGVLTQICICIGIFLGQLISVPLSTPGTGLWRLVPLASASLALLQILTSPAMIESPVYLAEQKSWLIPSVDERTPLLAEQGLARETAEVVARSDSLTFMQVLRSDDHDVKYGLKVSVLGQAFQQGSGINAVMYFSTGILSSISPDNAKYVSLFVTFVNVITTVPTIYLLERVGRRTLLVLSLASMSLSSIILAYSINTFKFALAAVFIVLFVVTFSFGLGPIPWLLLGEAAPPIARPASASAAVAMNWGLNLIIGLGFLPLRDFLSGGKPSGEGSVFYLFAGISALGAGVLWKLVR